MEPGGFRGWETEKKKGSVQGKGKEGEAREKTGKITQIRTSRAKKRKERGERCTS